MVEWCKTKFYLLGNENFHAVAILEREKSLSELMLRVAVKRLTKCFNCGILSCMKAWRVHSSGKIALDEMESQTVGADCVKLKVLTCGISGSDSAIYRGSKKSNLPVILGRQAVGFVSEIGSQVKTLQRGNRVVVFPYASCHKCEMCQAGKYSDCDEFKEYGVDEDGFMRDFAVVDSRDLYVLPDQVSDVEALFTEPIAAALHTVNKLKIEKGDTVVIVGATIIGLILAQVVMYYQAVPIVLDVRDDRLDIAKSLGVYYTVNTVTEDAAKKVLAITGAHMADSVAYLVSSKMPPQLCMDYSAPNTAIALVGTEENAGSLEVDLLPFLKKRMRMYAVADCGKYFSPAINLLVNKTVNVEPLISDEVNFQNFKKSFEEFVKTPDRFIKLVVKM